MQAHNKQKSNAVLVLVSVFLQGEYVCCKNIFLLLILPYLKLWEKIKLKNLLKVREN